VGAIESLYPERLAEHVERLAHHALGGEVWDKALAYQRQAGLRALERSAHREAAASFEQALAVLQHLPQTREHLEQAVDIRLDLPRTLVPLGEIERNLDHLRDAEAIAEALDDRWRLGRVAAFQAGAFWWVGEYERAADAAKRALAIAGALENVAIHVVGSYYLAMAHFLPGDYRRGAEILKPTVTLLTGDLLHERFGAVGYPSAMTRAWSAWCLAELGELIDAIASGEEAVRIAMALDHPHTLIHAFLDLGGVYLRKGEFQKAIPALERALELVQTRDFPIFFLGTAARLGLSYVLSGRIDDALPLLERATEHAASDKLLTYPVPAQWIGLVAEAYLLTGRVEEGLAERSLNLARARKERGNEAWSLRLLGEIASRREPPDVERAEGSYRQALALAEELGMRPLVAHCHLGLGKLYRRTGKRVQAQEHLAIATTMYREMGMTYWLEKAEIAQN
jgi:tetratricopeptide (TPR) repeat protein